MQVPPHALTPPFAHDFLVDRPHLAPDAFDVAKPALRLETSGLVVQPLGARLAGPHFEMERQLVVHVTRDVAPGAPVWTVGTHVVRALRASNARVTAAENRSHRESSARSCARPSAVSV